MKSDDVERLRELAMKATPGPWEAQCRDCGNPNNELPWGHEHFLQWELSGPEVPDGRGEFYGEDAHFIAACSPDRLLSLLDRLQAAERERDELIHDMERMYASLNSEADARIAAESALATARADALETAAKVCEHRASWNVSMKRADIAERTGLIAAAANIRALAQPTAQVSEPEWKQGKG